MLVKLINDIMYKEDKKENTYLYKWAIENGYEYRKIWQAVQDLQDFLYNFENCKNSIKKICLRIEKETEQLSLEMD